MGFAAWRYRISLSPVEHKTVVVFEHLLVGETFEFARRINVGRLKYNQLCRKVSPEAYELGNTKRRIGTAKIGCAASHPLNTVVKVLFDTPRIERRRTRYLNLSEVARTVSPAPNGYTPQTPPC